MKNKKIIGRFERINFPGLGVKDAIAKIDTGAYTGAIYATKIRVEGQKLFFWPLNNSDEERSTGEFRVHWVQSSNGIKSDRYFINTSIVLNGQTYPIRISLADRSTMKYPVLIGRKFLSDNSFIVDVSKDNS